ncbi:hypothetical protein BaRGS_00010036 [Batillaria attramentaria]|uniref:Uncharacterized protein n=1 Tax=Batillaria attramentaria TaxID=370345 RepID=A0ABD0LGE0_9CAEN
MTGPHLPVPLGMTPSRSAHCSAVTTSGGRVPTKGSHNHAIASEVVSPVWQRDWVNVLNRSWPGRFSSSVRVAGDVGGSIAGTHSVRRIAGVVRCSHPVATGLEI